ncbi:uncharacterized protein LOC131612748 [Vicia villosa]|uniref:uncharacterized protein LOC131612748 n=1 Tax=Vicia villosa TaxID=3911 RepID=UPI00273AFBD8|nr:uncharacterized protein LOC131612748 [Vicia villosa]
MASDETMMTTQSSLQDEDYDEDDMNDLFHHHHHHQNQNQNHNQNHHNLSRLSVCTSSFEADVENLASVCMSHLSIESFEADGDDEAEEKDDRLLETGLSSGSENESGSCYSLPATPPRRRTNLVPPGVKDYASENEVRKETRTNSGGGDSGKRSRSRRRRKSVFERGSSWENLWDEKKKMKESGGNSGESDQSNGNGVMVIARPKGGSRSLCMDLDEVKACRDLGFELEHERISAVSFSNSTIDNTSSGGNSPIANWRISGPGDDPRDVKARLKVWAQAVAIASASKYGS